MIVRRKTGVPHQAFAIASGCHRPAPPGAWVLVQFAVVNVQTW